MIELDPRRAEGRRRIAIAFLAVGAVLVVLTLRKDYPRAQPLIFRTSDTGGATLTASFTKVGEAEPRTGFTLRLPERRSRDVSHTIHVPDGDYIVTIELRDREKDAGDGSEAGSSEETTVARRVSLAGSEVVVPVPSRASE